MSSKPAGFQDITSNVLGYTINTSTPQCRLVEKQIAELPVATQGEIYGRFNVVCNRGDKDAAKGRKFLYTSLDYAGLSQQLGKVATDINTCIKILQLFNTNAQIDLVYRSLSDFAQKEIEAYRGQPQAAIAAYVEKYDPLDTTHAVTLDKTQLQEELIFLANQFRGDYDLLKRNAAFLKSKWGDCKRDQERATEIYESLSPLAQLLLREASPEALKEALARLFGDFANNASPSSIMHGIKLERLSALHQLLLKAYLGLPRHACYAFLKSNPNGSKEALIHYLSKDMEALHRQVHDEFKYLISEIARTQAVT